MEISVSLGSVRCEKHAKWTKVSLCCLFARIWRFISGADLDFHRLFGVSYLWDRGIAAGINAGQFGQWQL